MIAMCFPFDRLFQRAFVLFGAPNQDRPRNKRCKPAALAAYAPNRDRPRNKKVKSARLTDKIIFSDPNTSPIIPKPLTKKQLKLLFEELVKAAETLPVLDDVDEYD